MEDDIKFLQSVEILSQLTKEELKTIKKCMKFIQISSGNVLFHQGDEGRELYIVKSGKVAICIKLPNGDEHILVQFSPGNFFGDMSIFENAPRSATCRIISDSTLFSLLDKYFFDLMKDNPKIAIKIMYKMLNVITQRLQNTGGFLTDMVRWGEDASKRAITDPFTGCYNRRFLDDKLDDFFTTAKNNQQPFSLVMIDLDYFRQINEAYGHEIGDKTILEVVNVFKEYLREKDVIARYGGDEFTVLMPETPLKQAEEVAKTICKKVSNLTLLEGLNGPIKTITLSQGIAAFPESSEELKELKEKADKALYKAKEDGRNRAVCYSSAAE
jgi:diguanylate cyclase (GGDEF)-like protein